MDIPLPGHDMIGTTDDPTDEPTENRPRTTTDSDDQRDRVTHLDGLVQRSIPVGLALLSTIPMLAGRAAAQTTVGSSLCGTPIANFINSAAPLVVALAMVVGTVFAYVMHSRTGFAGDVEQAKFYTDWRNRAAYTAVTAPLLAFLLEMMIGFTGTGVASCIDLVPFF